MYTAALFDMDGLIFDTEGMYKTCWQQAAASQGLAIEDEFYATFIGVQDSECERRLARYFEDDKLCTTKFDLTRFCQERDRLYAIAEKQHPTVKPGFDALFHYLLANDIKLALVTSSRLDQVKQHFSPHNYLEHFKVVITAEDVTRGKPNPDCYLQAMRKLGATPAQCAVFEDSPNGILAGDGAGCDCFMVPDLAAPPAEIANKAKAVLRSLDLAIPFFK